jgi:beta-lactamase regulating signal transducer with metallopeptidase domain/outer membrane biosynthesis protein TonB
MNGLELLQRSAWAATLVLLVAFAANWLLRAAPAAWRHFLFTAVMGGLLVLPAAVRVMPKWGLQSAPVVVVSDAASATVDASTAPAAPAPSPWNPVVLVWLAGCVVVVLRFAIGRARSARMVRQATEAVYARELMDAVGGSNIRVLESAASRTALAAGILRPAVVLPSGAALWPVERLRAALLHELMHIRRRDLLAQAVGQAACCLYWAHPLAWLAAQRLRRERELACDNAVLASGIAAPEYARMLVESAWAMRGNRAAIMAMAEPSELELRVRALLDGTRDRRPLSRASAGAMVAALAVVLLPVAAITGHAQPRTVWEHAELAIEPEAPAPAVEQQAAPVGWGSIAGTVQDPTGARVPNCKVIATNEGDSTSQTAVSDPVGTYQFTALPAGKYTVKATVPGFKVTSRTGLTLQPDQKLNFDLRLVVGSISEAVTITAARPSTVVAPAAAPAPQSDRIRVGGMVQAAAIMRKVAPVYPEDQRELGVSGVVRLAAIVGKDGSIKELHALGGPAGLIDAAMKAASQWTYRPTLLNGEPVAVETNIDISFELK